MKKQDITALHSKTIAELQKQLLELSSTLARMRLAQKARKAGNTHAQLVADDMARVKAVLRSKELVATTAPSEVVAETK